MKRRRYIPKSRVLAWCRAQLPESPRMKNYSLNISVPDRADALDVMAALRNAMRSLEGAYSNGRSPLPVEGTVKIDLLPAIAEYASASFTRSE